MKKKISAYIKQKYTISRSLDIVWILMLAFVFRLCIANFGTLQLDHGTFVAWAHSLATGGFSHFYDGWSDYLPGYLYILWFLGKINLVFPSLQTVLFKLPAIIADVATGFLIYKIVFKLKNQKWAIIVSIAYLFNPAIFANSSLWGQVDSLTSLFSVFALYAFTSNYLLSAISLSIGTLMKPQAAFILPAILYLFLITDNSKLIKHRVLKFINYGLIGLLTFVLGFAPFNNKSNLIEFIFDRLTISSGQYPYGSINAFSFWGMFGFWKPDNITFWVGLGACIFIILASVVIISIKRPKAGEYLVSAISLLTTFLFMTRIHERHMLPVFAPLLISSVFNPILLVSYFGLSSTYVLNLFYSFKWITEEYKEVFNLTLVKIFIFSNLSMFSILLISIFKKTKINYDKILLNYISNHKSSPKTYFSTKDISNKNKNIFLTLILIFSIFAHVYSLGSIKEMYFDEIYHAFTAKLVLHNDPKAWEFWNPNPDGFAYEWTHPPISKLGMVIGMKIFGETPFGYRIPQALLGVSATILIYFLAKEIFKDKTVGILSAAIFSLAGLPLVLSRMGMNDSYVLFFSLLSVLLFIKDKNILSAFFFGLSVASKWSGIYAFPILFISHFVFKKKIKLSYLSFTVIPILVYIASYGLMFSTGHTWVNFVETQKQMWWYHTSLVATHPYTSPAWSWPLLLRPIYLYNGPEFDNTVARIYAFGNPIIFWFGLFSVIVLLVLALVERKSAYDRSRKLGFVVFSYLVFFLPWIASPRIMFLYHYLPSVPFLSIASGFVLRRYPKLTFFILGLGLLSFIYFYPHFTGLRIPEWLDSSYYWFPSWR